MRNSDERMREGRFRTSSIDSHPPTVPVCKVADRLDKNRSSASKRANTAPVTIIPRLDEVTEKEFIPQVNVIVCQRFIKARINSGMQETLIGSAVADLVTQSTGQPVYSRTVGIGFQRKPKNMLKVRLGTRLCRMRDLECVIDKSIPSKSAVLGMRALKSLGYQLVVGGRHAYQTVVSKVMKTQENVPTENEEREAENAIPFLDSEDEQMVFEIDPEEAHEIERQ